MKDLSLSSEAIKLLESKIGKSTVQSWFASVQVLKNDGGDCTILFPSNFVKAWVSNNYVEDLRNVMRSTYGARSVSLDVEQSPVITKNLLSDYSMSIDPKMCFNSFVVGESNQTAYLAAQQVTKDSIFNPVFIHAEPGHGKTHLLHSIANRFLEQKKRVCYISAEQYMLLFVKAIKEKDTIRFKHNLREIDLLLIDDVQFMQGKDMTQEELLHNMNYIIAQKKPIVIAADRIPSELKIDQRIKTRMAGGLVVSINKPSELLKISILNHKVKQYKKTIDQDVIKMITDNVHGSIRELEGALLRICAHIDFFGVTMNLENAKRILSDILRDNKPKSITSDRIIAKVEKFYNRDPRKVGREKILLKARQITMFLCRNMRNMSLPSIASLLGSKDHTNVIYSLKQVEKKLNEDKNLVQEIKLIKRSIELDE